MNKRLNRIERILGNEALRVMLNLFQHLPSCKQYETRKPSQIQIPLCNGMTLVVRVHHAGAGQHLPVWKELWNMNAIAHADSAIQRNDALGLSDILLDPARHPDEGQGLPVRKENADSNHPYRFRHLPESHSGFIFDKL
jgi:hypothetical protein